MELQLTAPKKKIHTKPSNVTPNKTFIGLAIISDYKQLMTTQFKLKKKEKERKKKKTAVEECVGGGGENTSATTAEK